jgi:nucleoside-diphosphate-sugar epimerase
LLDRLGVECIEGALTDPAVLTKAVQGVDAVIHSAAKVGDWGKVEDYRPVNVEATETLFRAAHAAGVKRFVLVSSLGVYEARDHHGSDETAPTPERHIDAYTQTKGEADRLVVRLRDELKLPTVILRPGFVYGPRDRSVMPRILFNLKIRLVSYFGSSAKKINNSYVGNVTQAILLGLDHPAAPGGVYNVRDGELVTKRDFFETIATLAGLPKPMMTYPLWFAKGLCGFMEGLGKTFGFQPVLTMARYKFMGLNLDYSIDRIRRELGYDPKVGFEEGMRRTIDWLREVGKVPGGK